MIHLSMDRMKKFLEWDWFDTVLNVKSKVDIALQRSLPITISPFLVSLPSVLGMNVVDTFSK